MKKDKKLKLSFIGLLMLLLIAIGIQAYEIKYYHPDINITECDKIINSIEPKYFESVIRINIYPKNTNSFYYAFWFYSGKINLYNGCDYNSLTHELAHNNNWDNKIGVNHGEEFKKALERIKNETWKKE